MNGKNTDIPEYMNMSKMSELLQLSRGRLYQLIERGVLWGPAYLLNKRPVYTREMALRNLQVKHDNLGINGQVIMFYSARPAIQSTKPRKTNRPPKKQPVVSTHKHADLIDALEALGLEDITASQIDSAILKCFPDGTGDVSEDEILREVFRHLKCRDTEHKQRT